MDDELERMQEIMSAATTFLNTESYHEFINSPKIKAFINQIQDNIRREPKLGEFMYNGGSKEIQQFKDDIVQLFGYQFYVNLFTFLVQTEVLVSRATKIKGIAARDGQTRVVLKNV